MESIAEPTKLLLSLVLGGLIGLEREMNEKSMRSGKKALSVVGVRSFALIGMLGGMTGLIYNNTPLFALITTGIFAVLVLTFYVLDTRLSKETGITTELAMIYSFLIGLIIALNILPIQLTLAISVVLLLLLSRKDQIKSFVRDIRAQEINAFISFAIVALVVLPFLPNTTYSLSDIPQVEQILKNFNVTFEKLGQNEVFNPFKIWLIVALITGLDILGYILERTLGQKRGWLLASIAGGFISSTATTQTLAQQSKTTKNVNPLLAAAIIANLASFFQIIILLGAVNTLFMLQTLPTIIIIIMTSGVAALYFLRQKAQETKSSRQTKVSIGAHEIFNIVPALKFAGLFLLITVFSKIALEFFGNSGFLAATAIGSFIGLDAVMINTAGLAGGAIDYKLGVIAFILANAVNLLAKSFYSYIQGTKEFTLKFLIAILVIIASSFLGLFFV